MSRSEPHAKTPALALRSWGSADNPTLLMLHGFLGEADDWQPLASRLERRFFCVAPALPGSSAEDRRLRSPSQALSIEHFAREVVQRIREQKLSALAGVLGYSMGGRVALAMLAELSSVDIQPDSLVLLSTNPGIAPDALRASRLRQDKAHAECIRQEGLASFLQAWYSSSVFSSLTEKPALQTTLVNRRLQTNDAGWTAKLIEELSPGHMKDYTSSLLALRIPCLLLSGADDEKYCALGASLAAQSSYIQQSCVAGAGHALLAEAPEKLIGEIERFYCE